MMKTKLLIALLLMQLIFGCSKESQMQKQFIGQWYLSMHGYWTVFYGNPKWEETNYDKTTTPQLLTFNKNGTYERISRSSQKSENGEWVLSNDFSEITFIEKNENGFIESQNTAKVSIYESTITLSYDNFDSVTQYQKY